MEMETLSPEEIHNVNGINNYGRLLKQDGLYLKVFILNGKRNKASAAEGGPFKIASSAVESVASSVVGRPYIVGPDPTRHIRGANGTAEEIIQIQKKWAIGEFVRHMVNQLSGNAYGIVEIYPEFVAEVKAGSVRGRPLPKYVSPMIEVLETTPDGQIKDGRILHVQAVDTPGYDPALAKVAGACEGMLNKCSTELRALGASSALKTWQETISTDSVLEQPANATPAKTAGASAKGDAEHPPAPAPVRELDWDEKLEAEIQGILGSGILAGSADGKGKLQQETTPPTSKPDEDDLFEIYESVTTPGPRPRPQEPVSMLEDKREEEIEELLTKTFDLPNDPPIMGAVSDSLVSELAGILGASGSDGDPTDHFDTFESVGNASNHANQIRPVYYSPGLLDEDLAPPTKAVGASGDKRRALDDLMEALESAR